MSQSQPLGGWIHSFTVTETNTHKKGYTIYKITSIVFPRAVPEALTCISVWKRFHDVKRLYRDLQKRHKNLSLLGKIPEPKSDFFKRFDPEVIKLRKEYIIQLLDFAAQHPALYKSNSFLQFFENGYSPNTSPIHSNASKTGNIEAICDHLDITYEDNISLIDPKKDDKTNLGEVVDNTVDKVTENFEDKANSVDGKNKIDEDKERKEEEHRLIREKREKELSKILTPMVSIEESDTDYIYEAALEFSHAVQAEVNLEYKVAHKKYKNGIEKLLEGSKDDTNDERKFIAKAKVAKYMARADEIYEKYILHCETAKRLSFQLSIDVTDNETIEVTYLERPWNQLSRYKVMQIINSGVLQVQDVTDKSIYILKGIEKPSCNSKTQSIFLPQGVPYMVELIGFFQSYEKLFLLLRQAKGGKLFDYIRTYTPTGHTATSLNEIFSEVVNVKEFEAKELNKITNDYSVENDENSIKDDSKFSIYDSSFIELLDQYKNKQFEYSNEDDNDEITHTREIIYETEGNNMHLEESLQADSLDEYIPSFDILSQDMETNDLLNCSQKLLQSVSNTLNKFKDNDLECKKLKNRKDFEKYINESDNVKDKCDETETNLKIYDIIDTQSKRSKSPNLLLKKKVSLPEASIKQWAKELLVAIESLHSKGVILGDLHTDNVLLGSKGQLLLSYFYQNEGGSPDNHLFFNTLVNESLCIAPERPLTMKSDWWSFGIILFELITGCSYKSCHPGGLHMYFEVQFPNIEISNDARNLLEGILVIEPEFRLDLGAIKSHKFFAGTSWDILAKDGINSI